MAIVLRTAEGKKRCRELNMLGLQCTKRKNHVRKEIDVVHQSGVFIWRRKDDFNLSNAKIKVDYKTPPGFQIPGVMFDINKLFGTPVKSPGDGQVQIAYCEEDDPCSCPACTSERAAETITATPEQQLTEWWMTQAEDEIARTVPKAIEYSAVDLQDIGNDLARTMGREVSDEEAAELGVFFYLRGKVARWVGAVMAGQRVSDDTLFDIGVYVRMVQRIRESGSWPGTTEPVEPKLSTGPSVSDDFNWSNRSGG